jgi:hypothetical protein
MSHCRIDAAVQYEAREDRQGLLIMTARLRPIHSSFETLRHANYRPAYGFGGLRAPANEQLTAAGYARINRPAGMFAEFIQR